MDAPPRSSSPLFDKPVGSIGHRSKGEHPKQARYVAGHQRGPPAAPIDLGPGQSTGPMLGYDSHGLEDPLSVNQQIDSGGRTSNLLASPWLSVQIPRQLLLQTQKFSMPCVMRVEVRP
jgi:hypothetical protein